MSNRINGKTEKRDVEFANLVKSAYKSGTASRDITVNEFVEEIKVELIKIIHRTKSLASR